MALWLSALIMLVASPGSAAQTRVDELAVGGFIGGPKSAITVLTRGDSGGALEGMAGWDADDELYVAVHLLYDSPADGMLEPLFVFWGPGAFIETKPRRSHREDLRLGASLVAGLGMRIQRIEVYLDVNPQLSIVPETEGRIGGGLGIRYFLRDHD